MVDIHHGRGVVDDLDIPEAGGRQQVANFVDFRQVAVFRRQRPGDREKRRPVRAFGDFGGDEDGDLDQLTEFMLPY